jgi:hypothetical protein
MKKKSSNIEYSETRLYPRVFYAFNMIIGMNTYFCKCNVFINFQYVFITFYSFRERATY